MELQWLCNTNSRCGDIVRANIFPLLASVTLANRSRSPILELSELYHMITSINMEVCVKQIVGVEIS